MTWFSVQQTYIFVSFHEALPLCILQFHACSLEDQIGRLCWAAGIRGRQARMQMTNSHGHHRPASASPPLFPCSLPRASVRRTLTALSGPHTVALAHCFTFRDRLYQDSNMDANLAALRKQSCPPFGGDSNLAPPDLQTPYRFANDYRQNPLSPWAPPLPPGALQQCLVGCLGLGVHHQRRRTL